MARYRKIDPRIWTDEKFRQLTSEQQRIALYVLTAQSNRIGLFSFSPGKACEDLRRSPAKFSRDFNTVCQTLKWEWDQGARVLYLPTWWRYNPPESANNVVGNLKDLDDLPATPLLEKFAANTTCLSDAVKHTFIQTVAKGYPHPSPIHSPHPLPNPSPTQEQEQEQEQEQKQEQKQDAPPAVEHAFEEFWNLYPKRNGKRLEKSVALKKFQTLKADDWLVVLQAVRHYAASELVQKGIGIKDAHRWLRTGKDQQGKAIEPWRDWIEPEERTNGKEMNNGKPRLPRDGFADRDYREGVF